MDTHILFVNELFVGDFISKFWVRINLFTVKCCYRFCGVKWFHLSNTTIQFNINNLFADCVVLITWSTSGYTPVGSDCSDALSSPSLLIKTWQLVIAHRVTRNEPKIHVICYIIVSLTLQLNISHLFIYS